MAYRGELDKLCTLWDACASHGIPEKYINKYLYCAMYDTRIALRNEYNRDYSLIAYNLYQWDLLRKKVNRHAW